MNRKPTEKLYVNLSASQVRKRLRGHGFGVRDIQAVDRGQAAISHTATGQHLHELRTLFADVLHGQSQAEVGVPVENLRNIGPKTARWLHEIGIQTRQDLDRIGPALAYMRLRDLDPRVSLNLLWSLAGALRDKDWREISEELKSELMSEVNE